MTLSPQKIATTANTPAGSMAMAADSRGAPPHAPREVEWSELPLCCPMPDSPLWNSHPRIYLPIQDCGRVCCPYCGAVYVLRPARSDTAPPQGTNWLVEDRYYQALARSNTDIDPADIRGTT